jgi:dephospho-CoA kinase
MKIIGVVGQPSSGKDTIAEYLVSRGYVHVSSSDKIREEMREAGVPTDRESMSKFTVEKRKERGNGYVAEKIAADIHGDTVVSGLRNMAEIGVFRQKFGGDFVLIAVEAAIETRYERAKARGRIGDNFSFERFKEIEDKERSGSSFHEMDKVIQAADHLLANDGTKEELLEKVNEIL